MTTAADISRLRASTGAGMLDCKAALEEAAKLNSLPYKRVEGEAAFYGPKLDFMFKDAIGREWQLSTIQCDFQLPMRFELEYTDSDGMKKQPVVIHRAISGSLERSMGILIEHFAGAFPTWLAPIQVALVPVTEKHIDGALALSKKLRHEGIRVETNKSSNSLGKKIHEAKGMKVPYVIVVGDKEISSELYTLETRDHGKIESFSTQAIISMLKEEIQERKYLKK
jgi:threonyl-tRNA synthetase